LRIPQVSPGGVGVGADRRRSGPAG
jgi:hypothetical protein